MDINNSTQTTGLSASATGAATTSKETFSADFETFLTLLTTQLQQQDPLSPMDSDKFTQQLVQYSQVEQSIKTNSNLERMLDSMEADRLTAALDYVGKWVELDGNRISLGDVGSASFGYTMPEGVNAASIAVLDENGQAVARFDAQSGAGDHEAVWNGLSNEGVRQAAGYYRIRVEAVDENQQPIAISTRVKGEVTGVQRDGDQIDVVVDGVSFDLSAVNSVSGQQSTGLLN